MKERRKSQRQDWKRGRRGRGHEIEQESGKNNKKTPTPASQFAYHLPPKDDSFVLATGTGSRWAGTHRVKAISPQQRNICCFRPLYIAFGTSEWCLVIFPQEAKVIGTQLLLWKEREWESDCKWAGRVVYGAWKDERSKTMAKWVGWEAGLDTPMLS